MSVSVELFFKSYVCVCVVRSVRGSLVTVLLYDKFKPKVVLNAPITHNNTCQAISLSFFGRYILGLAAACDELNESRHLSNCAPGKKVKKPINPFRRVSMIIMVALDNYVLLSNKMNV